MKARVLIVDDEKNIRRILSAVLQKAGYDTRDAEDGESALTTVEEEGTDCVITDLKMPGMDGMELFRRIQKIDREIKVVMLTAHGTVETAVEAMKIGAFDYLLKPFTNELIVSAVSRAIKARELDDREPTRNAGAAPLSRNAEMRAILTLVDRIAKSPTTIMITGESGTGKEIIARKLHEESDRREMPYIRVNCAAIPAGLVESELFGHERGAFTGAVSSKPGRFELADKGTLFLDEVGAIPLETQVKLLRAIQEQEFERVGSVRSTKVDVRLIAATNVDLKEEVAAGRFREDLYYRLNVVHLRLPPLRDRLEDLDDLVDIFIDRFNARLGRKVAGPDEEAMRKLRAYNWPGNIRELENAVERAVLLAEGEVIHENDFPEEISGVHPRAATATQVGDLKEASREAAAKVEIDMIVAALRRTRGNVTRAAKLLGLSRKGLQIKMREYELVRRQDGIDE